MQFVEEFDRALLLAVQEICALMLHRTRFMLHRSNGSGVKTERPLPSVVAAEPLRLPRSRRLCSSGSTIDEVHRAMTARFPTPPCIRSPGSFTRPCDVQGSDQLHILMDFPPHARESATRAFVAASLIASLERSSSSAACWLVTQRVDRPTREPVIFTEVQTSLALGLGLPSTTIGDGCSEGSGVDVCACPNAVEEATTAASAKLNI